MHASSLENMQRCYERYVGPSGLGAAGGAIVLDFGGADVNGSYRQVFPAPPFRYLTARIADKPGADILLADPYRIPLPDASVDIVLCGQILAHCDRFWLAFQEMVRVLKPEGFIFLIEPSAGPIQRDPVDCYRFYPDAYAALAKHAGCHLQDCWRDERGPWQDMVGVFRHRPLPLTVPAEPVRAVAPPPPDVFDSSPEEEVVAGSLDYLEVLQKAHTLLKPASYLEIGVRRGRSLALAACPAIGIDPAPEIAQPLPPTTQVVEATSDRFFEAQAADVLTAPPDLVFIDGMHLFEYALRDFMNVERRAAPTTLVLIDDIHPNHPRQAARERATRVWTGDVWKLHRCLQEARPDLFLLALDTHPSGLLLVAGLDPANRVLWDRYNPLVRHYWGLDPGPPDSVLRREGALHPAAPLVPALLDALRELRPLGPGPAQVTAALRELRARSGG